MLFEVRLNLPWVSAEPRKEAEGWTHIIWSHVPGSDCDCGVVWSTHFTFSFHVQGTLWPVSRMTCFFSVLSLWRKPYCASSHQSLAGVWRWKALKHWWGFGAAVVDGDSGTWSSKLSEHLIRVLAFSHQCAELWWHHPYMVQHSLWIFKLCPSHYWHAGFLFFFLINPVWISLVVAHTHTEYREHAHTKIVEDGV